MSFVKSAAEEILATSRLELASLPGASATLTQMLQLVYQMMRNRVTQSDSEFKVYKDDGTTVLGSASFSDNGTIADRGELS
jgi:hypothetical protein